jgi:hypothetical protein
MPLAGRLELVLQIAVRLVVVDILEVSDILDVPVEELVVGDEHRLVVEIVVGIVVVDTVVVVACILDHTLAVVVEGKIEVLGVVVVPDIVVDMEDTVVVDLVEVPFQEEIVLHS